MHRRDFVKLGSIIAATQLYEHGLPLVQIMKITGHKKLSTLQKYIKSDSDIQMMLEVGNSIGKSVK